MTATKILVEIDVEKPTFFRNFFATLFAWIKGTP